VPNQTGLAPAPAGVDATYQVFGRASLATYFDDSVIYRNLDPLDHRLPRFKNAHWQMDLPGDSLPRKLDREYAKAAVWFLNRMQEVRRVNKPLGEVLFVGDTLLNDGGAYRNICTTAGWPGGCFIGVDKLEQSAQLKEGEDGIVTANRWTLLAEWAAGLRSSGLHLDHRTAVIVDIDKTALGAKGRNDRVIDRARLTGIFRTMDSVLGDQFDAERFEQHYNELNRCKYHHLTADNQDYLAYICMVTNTGLLSLEEIVQGVETDSMDNMEQFTRLVNSRMMINHPASDGLREAHETVATATRMGDPTPFKKFRRQEFISTVEHMGRMPDDAPAAELLANEITLTEEVCNLVQWLKARNCLLLCLSDKPDEASCPDRHASPDLAPLHRTMTHRVGISIEAALDAIH
jgi:hypothetical protein